MTQTREQQWLQQNQQFLSLRISEIAALLKLSADQELVIDYSASNTVAESMNAPPALMIISNTFGLSPFEEFILMLCASYELDGKFAHALDSFTYPGIAKPCFGLALALFNDSHWSSITPVAPLRHWRLVDVEGGVSLVNSRLRIDERILHYLTGISYLDKRLQGLLKNVPSTQVLAPSLSSSIQRVIDGWNTPVTTQELAAIQLCGPSHSDMQSIAANACQAMDLLLYQLDVEDIPADTIERDALARLWQREAKIDRAALLIKATAEHQEKLSSFIQSIYAPTIIIAKQPVDISPKLSIRIDVPSVDASEQKDLWGSKLGEKAKYINGGLDRVVSQFSLSAQKIASLSQQLEMNTKATGIEIGEELWQACRLQSRKKLDSLAQRINSTVGWDDLILPETQKQILKDIVSHARQRFRVYETWGFSGKTTFGQGISALFYGPSGTGKTLAASVIAHELQLDLYQIDLSQVVNKYIGETEKNLARVFDAAEDSGAILLFDEADSLFAKRTEVKNSYDRNANMETSYLLQRMESYSGIAVLTTNLKKEIDTAFMRRIRFAIQFPFPDAGTRKQIWQRVFPEQTPLENIDVSRLASLDIAGGNIRNIALNAAFLAADENESVKMSHMAKAARREFSKLEKSIKESELRNWV
jgi:AAA+ superfamily predicted ATPase